MKFLSYFHDPDNLFIPLIKRSKIPKELKGSVVAVSPQTTAKVYEMVRNMGFSIVEGGPYGFARLAALKETLNTFDDKHFFVCDFDKMLHWLDTDRAEFVNLLKKTPRSDLIIVGRGPLAFKSYPKSWIETEKIALKVMAKALGKKVDLMNGPSILSRKAAELIVENAVETGVGSLAEWCILAKQANLKISETKVNGLTWEDPDRYPDLIRKSKSFENWKENTFDSLYEWRKRVDFLYKQVMAMIRLTEEPINPKYPFVKNKTYKNKNNINK